MKQMTDYEMAKNGDYIISYEPRARNTDHYTSHLAAKSMNPSAHYALIIDALKTSPAGKTLIGKRARLDHNQVSRRLNELEKQGIIGLTGKTVKSDTNRQEREWYLL
jgi:predicted Rossmann fold nucleotide-binding protein DprA/Smf involved in DNA uptake